MDLRTVRSIRERGNGLIAFLSSPLPQSPGQYYFKPMMKEFRFEPASQMITVEEGENLSINITGFKTAYR